MITLMVTGISSPASHRTLFAIADTRGRDPDSISSPEENLHYWKLIAEENDCYDRPYEFLTSHVDRRAQATVDRRRRHGSQLTSGNSAA